MLTQTLLPTIPDGQTVADGSLRPRSYAELRPDRQPTDPRRPFAHQRAAWEHLSAHLERSRSDGVFEGLLVMSTGAGKTFTATTWLLREIVNDGGRVLWLANHGELLDQATVDFHHAVGQADRRERVAVRVVAGGRCKADSIEPTDDIVLASVATMARHLDDCDRLLADPRMFVVVDEGHHAVAGSYRAIIDRLRSHDRRRLLGLTATPTRTIPSERPMLAEIFGNRIIHEVEAAELIERGILARPRFVRVRTGATIDRALTPADLESLERSGNLSRGWLDRIARIEERNAAIVDHYLQYRARYVKTLIFAANVAHAVLLVKRLQDAGVAAAYVACRRRRRDNRKVLGRFRDPGGGLDVLVNVGLLTEGADYPAIQTVLLARPTLSEILLSQMIGRALRGLAVGGTAVANVVWFEDRWRWAAAGRRVLDRVRARLVAGASARPGRVHCRIGVAPPWETIEALATRLRALVPARPTEASESMAERWIVLGGAGGKQSVGRAIAVYGHQRDGYDRAIAHLEGLPAGELAAIDVATLTARFFATGAGPPPGARNLGLLLDHFRTGGGRPPSFGLEDRQACDPQTVATLIKEGDLGERARSELLNRRYTPLARALYATPRDYHAAVSDALFAIQHPKEAAWVRPAAPVFEAARDGQGAAHRRPRTSRHAFRPGVGDVHVKAAAPGYDQADVAVRP
jgi:superfamily II DNA or RNA helicase